MLRAMEPQETRALEKETRALQAKADAAVAGWTCPSSAECCQLSATGKLPHLFASEWRLVLQELSKQQRVMPPPRADGGCPFLDAEGKRCTVYAARPIACRTFFCHRGAGPKAIDRSSIDSLFERLHAAHLTRDDDVVPRSLPEWYERERGLTSAGTHPLRGA
jgi:uncharacterized protein